MCDFTAPQIGLIVKCEEKHDIRQSEMQASIIWKMANGKYKPMTDDKSASGKKAIRQVDKLFGIEDQ